VTAKRTFVLVHDQARRNAVRFVEEAPSGYCVTVSEPTRNLEQNAAMWAMLTDVSEQVVWHGRRLSPESWKHIFTSSLKKQDVVPGLDGGFVVLGQSTSSMTKREMSDLLELIQAFGAQHDVHFNQNEKETA
jgi:hypothetical protein